MNIIVPQFTCILYFQENVVSSEPLLSALELTEDNFHP